MVDIVKEGGEKCNKRKKEKWIKMYIERKWKGRWKIDIRVKWKKKNWQWKSEMVDRQAVKRKQNGGHKNQ